MTHKLPLVLMAFVGLLAPGSSWAATTSDTVPGGVYAWVAPPHATNLRFNDQQVLVVNGVALVGIPMSYKPGPAQISYVLETSDADNILQHHFSVDSKQYTEQHITIKNQALVDPPAQTLARINAESRRQRGLYRAYNPAQDLSTGFIKPLQGITTSLFGHRRFFNGKPKSPHSGLDIAADAGTPIAAAGNAIVRLANDLYFNGNTIFLDHGHGLITMYCHMNKLLVNEGDQIQQGQIIGLVGATGRATGPHLHWSVSLNGNRVDPEMFMRKLNTVTLASKDF